jgi:hypothetical protein
LAFHSGREADHSPPSSAEVKEWVEPYLHSPIRIRGVVLGWGEHRDNFTFLPVPCYKLLVTVKMKENGSRVWNYVNN